ncbi:cytochrome P450 [Streptomyces sp. NPDC001663]|uniref:cytochrome P450 n=1 Tax=Streptomyces sp. NPDC001663 TaxID=3364597 RepID=UPI0036B71D1C
MTTHQQDTATHDDGTRDTGRLPDVLGGFDLTDQSRWAAGIPYELFARLRRRAPVLRHPPGHMPDGDGFWVLTRHEDIALAAGHDPDPFSAQGGGGRTGGGSHLEDLQVGVHAGVFLPMMDNPRHELLRGLFTPWTEPTEPVRARIRAFATELVDEAVAEGTGNAADLAERYAARSIALLLGAEPGDLPQVEVWAHSVCGFVDRRTGVADDNARRVFAEIQSYARRLLAARREAPAADAASVLATAELPADGDQPPISDAERELNFLHLLMTGIEQPRNTLAGGLEGFLSHPGEWARLNADRSLLPTAVEEVLRWAPPNPFNRRTATRDVRLRDVLIRAGDKVTLWWPAANRDEDVFADPDRFDVGRDPNPHLSFGHGTHSCMGDHFARFQIGALLEALLDRVAELRPAGPPVWAPNNKHTVVLDLPVEFVPHRPADDRSSR